MTGYWPPTLGPTPAGDGHTRFRVWAPHARAVELRLAGPRPRAVPMRAEEDGCFVAEAVAPPGTRYTLSLDGGPDRPDPASRLQPDGVHGSSEVPDPSFDWTDGEWKGVPLDQLVVYEAHVGAFTQEGTFDAAGACAGELRELGVTALEVMPVSAFPGARNWGYDGVLQWAVQASYGGPRGLKRLVNDCHAAGLALILDVVYNHLGPEGNSLAEFGPYFTARRRTPWGDAVNFDDEGADGVRRYFIESAVRWIDEFHVDGLRIDAVHAILDQSAYPFLHELTDAVHEAGRRAGRAVHVIAESDLNDTRLIREPERGGFGMDAQWSDDFHHALHTLLTGEREGYYRDFGDVEHLARAYSGGYTYTGQRAASRGRRHGAPAADLPERRFVVCDQNHDQVGNRRMGDRLSTLVNFERLKLGVAAVLCSPYIPMLFMGEEHAETAPFLYFIDHLDPDLVEAVRKGRAAEFASFDWSSPPPDPKAEETFLRSKIDRTRRREPKGAAMLAWVRALLAVRAGVACLRPDPCAPRRDAEATSVAFSGRSLRVRRRGPDPHALMLLNFADDAVDAAPLFGPGRWSKALESADQRFGGPGASAPAAADGQAPATIAPCSFTLYTSAGAA